MPRPLRQPKDITYPDKPWKGIARVTVRQQEFRFDGSYGSDESIDQHAEWVRIYSATGRPPEIPTVRASLLVQRENVPVPTAKDQPQVEKDRFPMAMGTAIICTSLLSSALVMSARMGQPPAPIQVQQPITSEPAVDGVALNDLEKVAIRDMRRQFSGDMFTTDGEKELTYRELLKNAGAETENLSLVDGNTGTKVDEAGAESMSKQGAETNASAAKSPKHKSLTPEDRVKLMELIKLYGHEAAVEKLMSDDP